jgi:hypothetical protein
MPTKTIDPQSNTRPETENQSGDGLSCLNPSTADEIVRRGTEAMERRRRGFQDWIDIAEALQIGRTEVMRAVHTNEPKGKRYEKAMGEWLIANGFKEIDKGTRKRLLECLEHRAAIEKWRTTLTDSERFHINHPDVVLRKWKAKTVVPKPNAPPKQPSPMAKLKEALALSEEENHRMRKEIARGGGDLWNKEDRDEDIAGIMVGKLSLAKAERVARAILKKVKEKRAAQAKPAAQDIAADGAETGSIGGGHV